MPSDYPCGICKLFSWLSKFNILTPISFISQSVSDKAHLTKVSKHSVNNSLYIKKSWKISYSMQYILWGKISKRLQINKLKFWSVNVDSFSCSLASIFYLTNRSIYNYVTFSLVTLIKSERKMFEDTISVITSSCICWEEKDDHTVADVSISPVFSVSPLTWFIRYMYLLLKLKVSR